MQSTNYYQEFQEGGGFDSAEINRFAMLNLNNNFAAANSSSPQRCTMCGSSVKRRSPSSSSPEEPHPKKQQLTLSTPPSSSADATATAELPPPFISQIASTLDAFNSLPILRRCYSDPVNSPGTNNSGAPSSQQFLNPQSPDNGKTNVSSTTPSPAKATASLPPLPRDLRRSVSDPTPCPNGCILLTTTSSSPLPHSAPRTWSPSPNSGELGSELIRRGSPNSKRVKRMKDRMREMIQWWDEVMREGEEEAPVGGCEEDRNNGAGANSKGNECAAAEATTETEEAVSVERSGESLIIHFKCPCSKGYQILLSGNNCYYKLM